MNDVIISGFRHLKIGWYKINIHNMRITGVMHHNFARTFASTPSSIPPTSTPTPAPVPKPTASTTLPTSSTSSRSWIDSCPPITRPYLHLARADKQIGTMLLLWPCWWSTALAANPGCLPDPGLLATFATGAIVMRSAGCTINDMWDKDYDKHVERTKLRPLAAGDLTTAHATAFLAAQLSVGLGVLLTLNPTCIGLGICSMPLVIAYPLMKRHTNWPQLFLGATFNWGALMGYPAVTGAIMPTLPTIVPLYMAGIGWTLVYDTLYAYQDRKDDAKLGLKSTALTLGENPQIPLTIIAGGSLLSLTAAGASVSLAWPFYTGITGYGAHLLWQIWSAKLNDTSNLWQRFSSNTAAGAVVFVSIITGKLCMV